MLDPKIPTILVGVRHGGQKCWGLGVKFDRIYTNGFNVWVKNIKNASGSH